ncbi:MAG: MaoC family dehydratase N-terminal domain-containing protein [Desulfitobacteriaceae bacterium]|nr:MaoC family dehydratase N-terminal domain-containing protein [Desulfitobacteriaceae bacterium]MDI6915374.1 MaoC family dehydratase N-terminal domain-containing protein [Desulfitobacteriaceae bacterium]
MINKDAIGRESEVMTTRVEAENVRRFAEAIGIPYVGEVPPTFIITFRGGTVPGLDLPEKGLIHGGQKFTYYRPIKVGDVLNYKRRVKNIYERAGKLGKMTFVVQEMEGRSATGDLVFTATSTLIAREEG